MKCILSFSKLTLFLFLITKLSLVYAVGGSETCLFQQGVQSVMNIKINPGLIKADAVVGSVLFKQDYLYDNVSSHQAIYCGSDGSYSFSFISAMVGNSSYGSHVYDTNIQGVGVRVSMYSSQNYHSFPTSPTASPFNVGITFINEPFGATFGTGYLHVMVELIKTTNYIGSGTLNYSVGKYFYAKAGNELLMSDLNITASIEPEASCKFDQLTPKLIELGNVDANSLSAPGSTANAKAFSLGLNCDKPANVSLAISGTSDPAASDDGVLKLDGSSKAKGVGVQILHDGKGVAINGNLPLGQLNSGASSVSLQARVYRTNEALVAGPFSAVTTVSIVYQ